MKTFLSFFLFLALVGCTTAPDGDPAMSETDASQKSWRLLEQGGYAAAANAQAGSANEPRVEIASSASEYRRLWAELIGSSDAPPADFTSESVVFLLLGQKSSGGWGIEVSGVETSGDQATIRSRIVRPEPGGIVTMAITAPFAVVAVPSPSIERAMWIEPDRSVVARSGEGVE